MVNQESLGLIRTMFLAKTKTGEENTTGRVGNSHIRMMYGFNNNNAWIKSLYFAQTYRDFLFFSAAEIVMQD